MRSLFFALIRWIACTSYGLDGKGITDTSINADGYLIITYTDGSTQNAGKVISSGSSDTNDYALGSIITMGTYEQDNDTSNGAEPIEWIVVQRLENKALLLSKYVLEYMAFFSYRYRDSSVRSFLIGDFYEIAFTDIEKGMIIESHIAATDISGLVGSTNIVYIPGYEEMTAMLLNNVDITPVFSQYALGKGARANDGVWLRDNLDIPYTRPSYSGICVYRLYDNEFIFGSPYATYADMARDPSDSAGVRPAMWIAIGE